METSHREAAKETEYSMLYDEEIVLFFDLRLVLKAVYFVHFQSLLQSGIIFSGAQPQPYRGYL
jgi:hypothetical protein